MASTAAAPLSPTTPESGAGRGGTGAATQPVSSNAAQLWDTVNVNTARTNPPLPTGSPTPTSCSPIAGSPTTGSPTPAPQATCVDFSGFSKLSRICSKITDVSAATWFGAALALGAFVISIRYGEPMLRAAKWTMLNDYRESCVSDRDTGAKLTTQCVKLLAAPAEPPPTIAKRWLVKEELGTRGLALWWTTLIAVPVVTGIVHMVWMGRYLSWSPKSLVSMARAAFAMLKRLDALEAEATEQCTSDDDETESLSDAAISDTEDCENGGLDDTNVVRPLPQWERHLNTDSTTGSPWNRKIILSLDASGDGVKGLASLIVVRKLMEKVREIERSTRPKHRSSHRYRWSGKNSQKGASFQYRICHYVDFFVGSGSGGLSAIMLGRHRRPIAKATRNFTQIWGRAIKYQGRARNKATAPGHAPRHLARRLEQALRENLRYRVDGTNLEDPNVMASQTVVVACKSPDNSPHLFRSYEEHNLNGKQWEQLQNFKGAPSVSLPLWKVARATTAGSSHLHPMRIGDSAYHAPTSIGHEEFAKIACEEVLRRCPDSKPGVIISVGIGNIHNEKSRFSNVQPVSAEARASGTHTAGEHQLSKYAKSRFDPDRLPGYYRFEVPCKTGIEEIGPFDWKEADGVHTQEAIERITTSYLQKIEVESKLARCAMELVQIRRRRQATARWEAFASDDIYYVCPDAASECSNLAFRYRLDLRRHAERFHALVEGQACPYDRCVNLAVTFGPEEDLLDHLRQIHKAKDPQVLTKERLEKWLDGGRRRSAPHNLPSMVHSESLREWLS